MLKDINSEKPSSTFDSNVTKMRNQRDPNETLKLHSRGAVDSVTFF